jgi:hypothetical protein
VFRVPQGKGGWHGTFREMGIAHRDVRRASFD